MRRRAEPKAAQIRRRELSKCEQKVEMLLAIWWGKPTPYKTICISTESQHERQIVTQARSAGVVNKKERTGGRNANSDLNMAN